MEGPKTLPMEQEVKWCVSPAVGALSLLSPALELLGGCRDWALGCLAGGTHGTDGTDPSGSWIPAGICTWLMWICQGLSELYQWLCWSFFSGSDGFTKQHRGEKNPFGFLPSFTFVHRVVCAAVSEGKIKTPLINLPPFTGDLMFYKPGWWLLIRCWGTWQQPFPSEFSTQFFP